MLFPSPHDTVPTHSSLPANTIFLRLDPQALTTNCVLVPPPSLPRPQNPLELLSSQLEEACRYMPHVYCSTQSWRLAHSLC